MAVIAIERPRAFISAKSRPPAIIPLKPITGGTAGVAGDILADEATGSTGYVDVSNFYHTGTGATNMPIGLCEQAYTAPAASGDLIVPATLFLPGFFYEMSWDAANATTACNQTAMYVHYMTADNALGAVIDASNDGTDGVAWMSVLGLISYFGLFHTSRYIAKAGTAVTAGTVNTSLAQKGVHGDDYPRVLCVPSAQYCAATQ